MCACHFSETLESISLPGMFGVRIFMYLLIGLRQFGLCCCAIRLCRSTTQTKKICGKIWYLLWQQIKACFGVFLGQIRKKYLLCPSSHNSVCLLIWWNTTVVANTLQMSQSPIVFSGSWWIPVCGQERQASGNKSPETRGLFSSAKTKGVI